MTDTERAAQRPSVKTDSPVAHRRRRARGAATVRRLILGPMAAAGLVALLVGPLPGAAALSGGRAYEQVSPPDKNGLDAALTSVPLVRSIRLPLVQASVDGDAIAYAAMGPFGETASGPLVTQILSRRNASGWSTRSINPPATPTGGLNTGSQYWGFSDDLSKGILAVNSEQPPLVPGATEAENFYRVDLRSRTYEHLMAGDLPMTPTHRDSLFGAAFSEDLEHVAIEYLARDPDRNLLHERVWESFPDPSGDPQLRIASVDPASGDPIDATIGGGWGAPNRMPSTISEDGSRILFMSPRCCVPRSSGEHLTPDKPPADLYLRDTGTGGLPTSTWVSEPEPGVPADPTSPRLDAFWGASADASEVFFTSGEKLTDDSTADPTTDSFGDLYVYDYAGGDLRDISVDTADPNGARVLGVAGVGEAGGNAYFVARGTLGTSGAVDGGPNLFHWQEGAGNGEITFIGTLASHTGDFETSDYGTYFPNAFDRTARVTPDGRHLVFESLEQLTEDDSDANRDVYIYDSSSGSLECVSCVPGSAAAGHSYLHHLPIARAGAGLPDTGEPFHNFSVHRNVTDDGGTVFFDSEEDLIPSDTNRRRDVYEYDTSSDNVALISSGQSASDSYFLDATPDGDSVFFITRERLVALDNDDNYDVYDARVGGGIPAQNRVPPPGCQGDACQGEPSSPPASPEPGTSGLQGPDRGEGDVDRCERLADRATKLKQRTRRLAKKKRRAARRTRRLARKSRQASGKRAKRLSRRGKRMRRRVREIRNRKQRVQRRAKRTARRARRCDQGGGR